MSEIVPTRSVKRPGSPLDDGSGSEAKKLSRKKVEIPEDVWLLALKFLTGLQWSKMRLVSHQLNSLLQRNISHLPLVVIDEVSWSKRDDRIQIVVKELLFIRKLDINMEQFLEILYHPALYIKVVSMQSSQQDIQHALPADESRYIRCDRFKLENVPSSSDNVFGNRSPKHSITASALLQYISWIKQKVRANQIDLHNTILQPLQSPARVIDHGNHSGNVERANLRWQEDYQTYIILQNDQAEALDIISDFIFGPLRICASKVATFSLPNVSIHSDSVQFLDILIAKFRTLSVIESGIPKIQIYPYPISIQYRERLGPNLCENEDTLENDIWPRSRAVYILSNKQNRMRISFNKTTYFDPQPPPLIFRGIVNMSEKLPVDCYDVNVKLYTV